MKCRVSVIEESPGSRDRFRFTHPLIQDTVADSRAAPFVKPADVNMPGILWGKILRSPHAYAGIRRDDISAAWI